MAELYIGTPNGIQKIGTGNGIVPKGKVEFSISANSSPYSFNLSSDKLKGKSFIDITFDAEYVPDMQFSLRVIDGFTESKTSSAGNNAYSGLTCTYDSSTGKVSGSVNIWKNGTYYVKKIIVFYYE